MSWGLPGELGNGPDDGWEAGLCDADPRTDLQRRSAEKGDRTHARSPGRPNVDVGVHRPHDGGGGVDDSAAFDLHDRDSTVAMKACLIVGGLNRPRIGLGIDW